LIIDEAHEIQNGKRGIILQNAIDITLSRFSTIKILFASPLIKNPAYFLSLFGKTYNGSFFVETISPVSQNLITLSEIKNKPKEIKVALISRNSTIPIGSFELDFKMRSGRSIQKAKIALAISSGRDSVISFANGPAEAEKVACHIAENIDEFEPSKAILAFVDFLKREIHEEYILAKCVLKGIGFHYGKMPSLVRIGIENLFKDGDLKIICCTSTLLQGVNLPAKHIIIENPMSGDNNPMTRADFLNLAGRAGRLLHEFHGNIWCIRPQDWKSECYIGDKLQEISSAISNVMEDGGISIQEIIKDEKSTNVNQDEAEAAFGKLYHDYLIDPELSFAEKYRNEHNSEMLDKTFDKIKNISITLPTEIIEKNQSLRPDHLQSLYEYLQEAPLNESIPLSPYIEGSKIRMEHIFTIVAKYFKWEITELYHSWISYLAYQWVWGYSIGSILSKRVTYIQSKNSKDSTSKIIRDCLGVLEEAIRFKLVKYFSAYIDILRQVSIEKGGQHKLEDIEPYHIYLEFGSCSRHALNLMALGISRFTALHLEKIFDLPAEVEAEAYLEIIRQMSIDSFNMPMICKKEIKDLLGL
jgi:hypothetical protein